MDRLNAVNDPWNRRQAAVEPAVGGRKMFQPGLQAQHMHHPLFTPHKERRSNRRPSSLKLPVFPFYTLPIYP